MKVNINKMYKNKRKIDDERTQKCCYEIVLVYCKCIDNKGELRKNFCRLRHC